MKKMRVLLAALAVVGLAGCSQPSEAVDAMDAVDTFVTVYPDGSAVVADSRQVTLEAGKQTLQLTGLPEAFRPGTLWLADDGVSLLASSFQQGTSRHELLQARVGETITLLRADGSGGDVTRQTTLLSAQGTPVVRLDGQVLWLSAESPWRIALADVPQLVHFQDTLALTLSVADGGTQSLDLIYQMRGLSWSASYVARLDRDAEQLTLRGQAQIENHTGKHWHDVGMALIAGEVNRAHAGGYRLMAMRSAAKAVPSSGMQAESVGGYYRYTLDHPVSLAPDEQRNVTLIERQTINVQRQYVLTGSWNQTTRRGQRTHATIRLRFKNTLGKPLPAGTMRVYGAGKPPLLLGAAHVSNTPEGGVVTLTLGQAFDITARRETSDIDEYGLGSDLRAYDRQITLYNASEQTVQVRVIERLPDDWNILSATAAYEKLDAHHVAWTIKVPGEGSTQLKYRLRYRT